MTTPVESAMCDAVKALSREEALAELTAHLQTAVQIELATIPIYLYTYYSIVRNEYTGEQIRPADVFANRAGGLIMSVVVEEMLHLSLSSNIFYSLTGKPPVLYGNSPGPYPTPLPHHKPKGPPGPGGPKVQIPLSKLTYEQLWHFLQIEYPEQAGAPPEGNDWETIGQFYDYIRCLINHPDIKNSDFQKGPQENQIQDYNYSPNNIDTAHPRVPFDPWGTPPAQGDPLPPPGGASAAAAVSFSNFADSHAGATQLITIGGRQDALDAIDTICDQGEGYARRASDDTSGAEESHYYKFLTLQSQFEQYPQHIEHLSPLPVPPDPALHPVTAAELDEVVVDYPLNPTGAGYGSYEPLADYMSAIYQYMLILTESIFKVPNAGDDVSGKDAHWPKNQKLYFNVAMHRSMIWLLDKVVRAVRRHTLPDGAYIGHVVAPTFENYDLGNRKDAYENLLKVANGLPDGTGGGPDLKGIVDYYTQNVLVKLPDVGELWADGGPPQPPHEPGTVVDQPAGPGFPVPAGTDAKYRDVPKFPGPSSDGNPPGIGPQPDGLPRHACMGLNSCKASDRYGLVGHPTKDNPNPSIDNPGETNACAGRGYCSTTPDHTCHVKNACRDQGGCGLYGTAEELSRPAQNACKGLGSCATPINAERFSTNGENQGKSVWLRARALFEAKWAEAHDGAELGPVPEPFARTGPTYLWVSAENTERGNMTACGGSGLSGAGGCA